MKTKNSIGATATNAPPKKPLHRDGNGMGIGPALLGVVCVAGVLLGLALFYSM